jgi:hypothetical protein
MLQPKNKKSSFETPVKSSKFDNYASVSGNNIYTNTGVGKSSYDDNFNFDVHFDENNPLGSVNEYRAEQQSGWIQLGALPFRATAKAATEVLKLAPIVYGVGKAMFEDNNTSTLEDIFNNEGIKALDEMNQSINTNLLPVYVKDSVKNGNLMDNLLSTSFYATEGADGLGFMASMFVPGMILSKFALGSKLIGGLSKIGKMTKMAESAEGSVQVLKGLGWSGRAIDSKLAVLGNSMIEAGAEAAGVQNDLIEVKNSEIQSYQNKGYSPEEAEQIFNQQHPDWDTQVASAMKGDFLTQLPMLLGTGAIMHKAIFGKTLDKVEKTIEQGIKGRVASSAKQWGKALLSEGFIEEGGQTTLEQYYTKKATEGKLGNGVLNDINIGDLTKEYINTVSSTDGQKAIFLGMLMGGPAMSMEARREYKKGLKDTNNITNGVNSAIDDHYLIHENDIYEKNENGKPIFQRNEKGQFTNKKVINSVKAAEVAKAYKNTEADNAEYDRAVAEGDESLQKFIQNRSILKMIAPAIQNGELGLKILEEELNNSSKLTEIVERDKNPKLKETSKDFNKQILDKAKHLQEQNEKFKDFASDVVKIDDPRATKEDNENYLNHLNSKYIEVKSLQYDKESELKQLEERRNKLYDDLEIDPLYELNSEFPVSKLKNTSSITNDDLVSKGDEMKLKIENSPLASKIEKDIQDTKNQILKYKKDVHDLWNNKSDLNTAFKSYLDEKEKVKKSTSPEEVAKNDEVISKTKSATTVEEVNQVEKTSPKETVANPAVKETIETKKAELKIAKEVKESGIISNAKEDDEAFNGTSKTQTYSTEGSDISDELTPVTSENTTTEEDKEAKTIDPTQGKGVKLISYNRKDNEVFSWIKEQFPKGLAFERNPVDKIGTQVSFEINQTPGVKLAEEALAQFKAGNLQNIQLLIDYLPINIKLAENAYLPIETRRVNGEMNPETEMLRKSLITSLINGVPIENMNSNITGQYKGVLQVESQTAENSLLDLSGVDGLKYIKENTYFVNIHGQLENVLTGQTRAFQNKFTKDLDRTKNYAAGEIYLMVPQADGVSQFPLKLNISKLTIEESEGLFQIYKEILTQDKGSNTTLSEVSPELLSVIENIFSEQLKIITTPSKIKDIKLGEIIDLLVHESDKPKSRINVTDGVLYFGENGTANSGNINELKEEIIYFLHTQKRHQIKIKPKTAEDNQRTNLSSNSANYIKYLVEGKILSTNAVVNEPLFQGYTNLFISPTVTIKSSETKKSTTKVKEYTETEIENRLKGVRTVKELAEGFKTLSKEQQDLYKPLFTEKRIQIEDKGKVKVSDAGAQIASNNFEGLDFGDKKETPKEILDSNNMIGKTITANQPFNKGSITGEVKSIKSNKIKKGLFSITLTNGENISWQEGSNNFTWVVKNNSENVRNVENNSVSLPESTTVIEDLSDSNKFVSSSDIPNTVENKQQVDKQNDVFKEPKGLEGQKDTKTITLLKDKVEKGTATETNLKQLEDLKNKYGEEYVKKCK